MDKVDKKIGCLLIHGFGGDIREVSPLADALKSQGYIVSCPSLKGHTGKRRDLNRCTHHNWIESAEKSYHELRKKCHTIFIVGFSMGGLIAIQIANKYVVDGIVTMNTPIYVWNLKNIGCNILEDIQDKKLNNTISYFRSCTQFPLKSLVNFKMLLKLTKNIIPNINSPLFIAQSLKDDTVKIKSANYIYDNTNSCTKQIEFYKQSGHLILWSKESSSLICSILSFFNRILS